MRRRELMAAGAAVIADWRLRIADSSPPNPKSTIRNPQSAQEPSLGPEVFQRRLERARAELQARRLDLLIATPGTNYEYLTGYNPGRSERLIALLLPVTGAPAVVCRRSRWSASSATAPSPSCTGGTSRMIPTPWCATR